MKIDFSKIEIEDVEGNIVSVDVSKELGNMMWFGARDISVADLGRRIYREKEVELSADEAKCVCTFVDSGFKAVLKRVLLPLLCNPASQAG